MRNMLTILTLAFSISGYAADEIKTSARCHTTGVTDGGYNVRIVSGGFIGYLRAEVSEVTFFGSKHLATIPVKKINQLDGVEYVGPQTRGNTIQLTIDFNSANEDRYKGSLRGNINGEAVPPVGMPEFGEMSCLVPLS